MTGAPRAGETAGPAGGAAPHGAGGGRPPGRRPKAADFLALTKPGITRMVLLTSGVGFFLGSGDLVDASRLLHALIGIALIASGSNGLNQLVERDRDALMHRTRDRPLPAGRLTPRQAALFAGIASLLGIVYLGVFVNALTAAVVAATLLSYLLVYTPLKRRTSFNTLVGAVPGALPIVAGWTAAGGPLDARALTLFAVLYFWQIPHFLALAYLYRDDYLRGGFVMLGRDDPEGHSTGRQAALYALAFVPVALLPSLAGTTGSFYFFGALIAGAAFLAIALPMAFAPTAAAARRVFFGSVTHLPVLLVLMVTDRTFWS
jgi:protoheme IX farnesyltransferase